MPKVAIIPINIFCLDSFNLASDTLEHNVPTITTDNKLQDLTVTTIG